MTTLAPTAAVRAALERLIDYAGLFPPAMLPMDQAVATYTKAQEGDASWILSRFIVKVDDLDALRAQLAGTRIELSVIATPATFDRVARARREDWATIGALEVPLGDDPIEACERAVDIAALGDLPLYVERPRGRFAMPELARRGYGAKLRCGGVEPSAFPSVDEVAAFIYDAVAAGVPFKATAGLHHPVRHFNKEAGVMMHGFLNLLLATARAFELGRPAVQAAVAEEDPAALPLDERTLLHAARQRFVAYGSCSFDEPIADLRALHVLAAA